MLILTRRPNERLIARTPGGEVIEFMILGINGSQVDVGVTAPKTVSVHREEIDRIKQMEKANDDAS